MSVAVDVARDGVRVALSEARVCEIVRYVCRREHLPDALISVAFITRTRMARLNREFLGHAGATDIITFELHDPEPARTIATPGKPRKSVHKTAQAVIGDIYISPEVAGANARDQGIGVREELVRLVVHGTLHVLGYTHGEGEERMTGDMWRRQEALVGAIS
ncbi:MAG: rRNA maturation RNase YbeY [Gemmatimonadaceae bacterium]